MEKTHQEARRKRVNRLKRIIVFALFAAIMIPSVLCIILAIRVHGLEKQLEAVSNAYENLSAQEVGAVQIEQKEQNTPKTTASGQAEVKTEDSQAGRRVYLTFDDGPSGETEEILRILDEYQVKATFFVTGEEAQSHPERYQEIVDAGHTLGMHSYSHKYSEIYESEENFALDLKTLYNFLYDTTGVIPQYYRFPGGSSNTVSGMSMSVFTDYLARENIIYYDWNISSKDASNPSLSADEIFHNCIDDLERYQDAVILMHDSPKKASTVEALPRIITYIQQMDDTSILPITEDTTIVQHKSSK